MPSPFPGMDPYLEDPDMWRGVHHRLIYCASKELKLVWPPGFAAVINERLYVVAPKRSIYPDVAVLKKHLKESHHLAPAGTAVLERMEDPPEEIIAHPVEIAEPFIEIRTGNDESVW